MAFESVTTALSQVFAGSTEIRSKKATVPANQAAIPALTPLKRDASFNVIPATLITDEIVGLSVPAKELDANGNLVGTTVSASIQTIFVYTHGDFWQDKINFASFSPALDTDAKKSALFDATGINIKVALAGQV
jgi:hypothetical protein